MRRGPGRPGGPPTRRGRRPADAKDKIADTHTARKTQFTTLAICELSAAVVLGLAGIILALSTWKDFRLKTNFQSALLNFSAHDFEESRRDLEDAISGHADYGYPNLLLARLLVEQDRLEEAEKSYKELPSLLTDPKEQAAVYLGLASIELRRFDKTQDTAHLDKAEEHLEQVGKKLSSDAFPVLVSQGHVYLRGGEVEKASNIFFNEAERSKLGSEPPFISSLLDYHLGRAYLLFRREDYGAAYSDFNRAFALNPSSATAETNMAFAIARRYASEHLDPEDDLSNDALRRLELFMNELHIKANTVDEFLAVRYRKAILTLRNSKAVAYMKTDPPHLQASEKIFHGVWRDSGNEPAGLLNLYHLLIEEVTARQVSHRPMARRELSEYLFKARAALEKAVKSAPVRGNDDLQATLHNNMAWILLEFHKDVNEEPRFGWLDPIKIAYEYDNQDATIVRNLAITYDLLGRKDAKMTAKAVKYYRETRELDASQLDVRRRLDQLLGVDVDDDD